MRMAFLRKGQEPGEVPTIYDVARECGVSPSTVSRAFSRPGRVSPATAERIKAAAERLGYRTNPIARALVAGRTAMIAVVVSDITNPVYFPVIRGAEQEASAAGFSMLLCDTRESARTERADIDRALPIVEGLVLASSRMSDATIRTIAGRTPLVVLNRAVPAVPSVVTDNARGMRRAVEHLGELGHTAITYVAGPEASWANGIRWRAVQEGAHELELRARRIGPFSPTVLGGLAAASELMNNPSTAVIAYNDLLAIGVLRGLARAGVAVPAQISVVGFDNIFGSDFCTPSLTTVAAPLHALGATAVKQVLAQIRGGRPHPAEAGVLPAQLMVRESTAPPPPGPVA
jgi:LacI family transcriptional regulator, repressor for deo operon, udp, cdd, tsx, nupC, and nupG